jgi:hypothetical protein
VAAAAVQPVVQEVARSEQVCRSLGMLEARQSAIQGSAEFEEECSYCSYLHLCHSEASPLACRLKTVEGIAAIPQLRSHPESYGLPLLQVVL